jgi:methionine-rich copper-binding protein CopC
MACLRVIGGGRATLGWRTVIAAVAVAGPLIGSAGMAVAAADPSSVTSPSTDVVAHAPLAVSVTFAKPLRAAGASLLVLSPIGDVGQGRVTTNSRTLRRELRVGAPSGQYTIVWRAQTAKGHKMSGSFSFIAARGNSEEVTLTPSAHPGSGISSEPGPSTSASSVAGPVVSTPGVVVTAVTPTASPSASASAVVVAGAGDGPQRGSGRSVSSGFTVVPLTVGALLVLAAGLIARRNRPRRDVYSHG